MRSDDKPYSPASEENKTPILTAIEPLLRSCRHVLEIGSGTGQHAVYFASAMPWLTWQATDVDANLPGIRRWLDEARLPNLPQPVALDVLGPWRVSPPDAVFSANTAHIMSEAAVAAMLAGIGAILPREGLFLLYGPFNEHGRFTSDSNRRFDAWLRAQDPNMGLRDVTQLAELGKRCDLRLTETLVMPVNNRILVWRRNDAARPPADSEAAPGR